LGVAELALDVALRALSLHLWGELANGTHETYVTYGKLKAERCAQAFNVQRPTANLELFTV